jgi:hypothetical protein
VDDREVLCIAALQELLGFETDHKFYQWFESNSAMQSLFPRRLSRQNFVDRRTLLTPILQRLCLAFGDLMGEGHPPFSSSTPIPSTSADRSARGGKNASAAWPKPATAPRSSAGFTECAST